MTEQDVRAGGLYVEVGSDTTGFGRDLQRKIDAEVRGVRARVQAEIDARRLQADLNRAAKETRASLSIPVTIDKGRLVADLKAAVLQAQRSAGTITVDVDADTSAAEAEIDRIARDRKMTLEVDADAEKADAEIDRAARNRRSKISVDFDYSALLSGSSAILSLMKFPAIAAGIEVAVAAVAQLGAGLISLVSAAAPAVNLLATLPAIGGAIVQGLAPVVASFLGIGKAVKAMNAEQAKSGSTATSSAAAQEAAAQRIVAAQRALRDAHEQADQATITGAERVQQAEQSRDDAIRTGNQQVADAERSLADAQRSATYAQEDLNAARVQAKADLEAYADKLADAALSERSAELALEQAQQNLDAVNRSATSTDLDRKEAQLQYDEAVQRYKEAQEQNAALKKEAADAEKAGVNGAKNVVDAKRKVQDANRSVADQERQLERERLQRSENIANAERAVADAQREQAIANRDAAQRIQEAQDALTQAVKAQTDAEAKQSTTAAAATAALKGLGPAGQSFAKFLTNTLEPKLKSLRSSAQEAFLPPLQDGLTAAMRLLPNFDALLSKTGGVMGGVADRALTMVSSGPWRRDFATITDSNVRVLQSLGGALDPILRIIRDLTVAAGPFVEKFAKNIAIGAQNLSDLVHVQREMQGPGAGLTGFFQRAYDAGSMLWDLFKDLFGALHNIGQAAAPAGRQLFTALDKSVEKLKAITEPGTTGGNALKTYFDNAVPGVKALGRLFDGLVAGIGKIGADKSTATLIDQVTTKFVPALVTALQSMSTSFGPAFVQLLTTVAQLFGDLGGGSGALTAAARSLDLILRAVNAIVKVPGIHQFVLGLLAIGGAATGIGLTVGAIGKLGSKLGGIMSKVPGASKLWDKFRGALGLSTKEIDKELPKDQAKKKALDDVETSGSNAASTLGGKLARGAKLAGDALLNAGKRTGTFLKNMALSAGALAKTAAQFLIVRARTIAATAAELAQAAAAKAVAAAQWLLNAAMDANPIVLIIGLVVALGAAFVVLWQRSDTFRKIVTGAFDAVKEAAEFVWNWVKDNWPYLFAILTGPLGLAFVFIAKHWEQTKAVFADAFKVISAGWQAFWTGLKTVGLAIWHGVRDAIAAVWDGIKALYLTEWKVISAGWQAFWTGLKTVARDLWGAVKTVIDTIWGGIKGLFTGAWNTLSSGWSTFWTGLKNAADSMFGAAKTAISNVLNDIKGAFRTTVSAIGQIWGRLKSVAEAPVRFVVNTVYNNGIRWAWNKVADLVNLPPLPEGKFAHGGVIPGYAPGRDTVRALVSPGEGILVPEAVRGLGGAPAIHAINSTFSARVAAAPAPGPTVGADGSPAFGIGGIWHDIKGAAGSVWHGVTGVTGAVKDVFGDAVGALKNLAVGGLRKALTAAFVPVRHLINANLHAPPVYTGALGGMMNQLIDGVLDLLGKKDAAAKGTGDPTGPSPSTSGLTGDVTRWSSLVDSVLTELGQSTKWTPYVLRLISGESSGDPESVNKWDSNWQAGHPSVGLAQVIDSTFAKYAGKYARTGPFSYGVSTDPYANVFAGLNYGVSRYGGIGAIPGIAGIAAMMSGGSYVGYHTGGVIPGRGERVIRALGGEAVLTEKARAFLGDDLIDRLNGLGGDVLAVAAPSSLDTLVGAARGETQPRPIVVQDRGVVFEEGAIVTNNPVAEPASDSINRRLRAMADIGVFGP
jgi:phage-related protein